MVNIYLSFANSSYGCEEKKKTKQKQIREWKSEKYFLYQEL